MTVTQLVLMELMPDFVKYFYTEFHKNLTNHSSN